mgnify:CR=1 FL=1
MKRDEFVFCPYCGSKRIKTFKKDIHSRKWLCEECGFDLYNNIAAAVGLVIQNENGEILFERRAKEPRKGFLAFPGGFCDSDESGEEAAKRECLEETGVLPQEVRYLCSFPNTYEYKEILYKTCDMFFLASLPKNAQLLAQKGEVDSFEWIAVKDEETIESIPLAFESAKRTLKRFLQVKNGE